MPNIGEKKEFNWTKMEKTQTNPKKNLLKPNKTQKTHRAGCF
jgi:hypothetical protein